MSQELIDLNEDLRKLRDDGYSIEIKSGFALVHDVPYVNSNCNICRGILVSSLSLSGDTTIKPDNHTIFFSGEHPCNKDGTILEGIKNNSETKELTSGLTINHLFSNKPPEGYNDYYEKFTRYIDIISAPANSLDNSITAKTFNIINATENSVFNYHDTNTSRAGIGSLNKKFENLKIGIIGLGGTGSYILDLIAKTPVLAIHLFDDDGFLQHNAFRAPGAPSIEKLREKYKKVDYFAEIYKNMHKNIYPHPEYIDTTNIDNLLELNFVFICLDKGKIKREIINKLLENNISFIDVGMGIDQVDDALIGSLRVTTGTSQKNDHLAKHISFSDIEEDAYATNIQIADLNSLNAALAVIKWKKIYGFYQDIPKEHQTIYAINIGEVINDDSEN